MASIIIIVILCANKSSLRQQQMPEGLASEMSRFDECQQREIEYLWKMDSQTVGNQSTKFEGFTLIQKAMNMKKHYSYFRD